MCGISTIAGPGWQSEQLMAMIGSQDHRGPDDRGAWTDTSASVGLGHNRLSIIDLSAAGHQPMASHDGRFWLVFNGEIYNYVELRAELSEYPYRTRTDTEIILAAYERWGERCLDRFLGMFAFILWDVRQRRLFAARDRFGVKPLHYHHRSDGTLLLASEIKALHEAGVPAEANPVTWASYLTSGMTDHSDRTFWRDIRALPAGHMLTWHDGRMVTRQWYDVAERIGHEWDQRSNAVVREEYSALLSDSIRLRFRSDVPVGINLSGGVDSSLLLGLVHRMQGSDSNVRAFTFATGDSRYDELPWVGRMLADTNHPSEICFLHPAEVPVLAEQVQWTQDEPFGGLPTLCYARLFERARECGVKVLLDGQGMDEQWAGYDYYLAPTTAAQTATVQGTASPALRPECLVAEFRDTAAPALPTGPFPDRLRNLQYRDLRFTKIPRALRFNDRASMRASTELREPFLDHRLVELALRQPVQRKIANDIRKVLLREIAQALLPKGIVEAPKRPLQTPQREWLRGPLRSWASDCISRALAAVGGSWLDSDRVRREWQRYLDGDGDNSVFVWQWVNLGLLLEQRRHSSAYAAHGDEGIGRRQAATP